MGWRNGFLGSINDYKYGLWRPLVEAEIDYRRSQTVSTMAVSATVDLGASIFNMRLRNLDAVPLKFHSRRKT
jgi:hypothetical protein